MSCVHLERMRVESRGELDIIVLMASPCKLVQPRTLSEVRECNEETWHPVILSQCERLREERRGKGSNKSTSSSSNSEYETVREEMVEAEGVRANKSKK